ncbi:Formin-like protein 3 [Dendrobium catenatum]|uniref:Formin-like protein 3 n=1 Tax=Dendrobium catenatum TaxID=906689 RepID=A0A2I0WNU1_9ASPA|nr:Formin-like protein 3 [Dendrobium catenatum]
MLEQDPLSRRPSVPSPAPTLRPTHQIQTGSTALPPAPTPATVFKWLAPVLSLPPNEPPLPEDDHGDFSPTSSLDDFLVPAEVHPIPHLSAASNSFQTIIIAVVVTEAHTFTLAAFCFYCCNKYAGSKYQIVNGQKDERPICP